MRDFRMISHLAMYSGVSEGAFGARPFDKSPVGAERVGGGGGVALWPAPPGAAWPAPAPPRPCWTG